MDSELEKKNNALKYLGRTSRGKEKFIFSKLGNELTLITTKLCNLNCPFCYDKANIFDKVQFKKVKDELTSKQIADLIRLCKKIGVKSVRLTGGEAILKPGFFEILKACANMEVSLCSNGLVLDKYLTRIMKIHPRRLHIHLSLEGLETHKAYRVGSDPYKIIELALLIKKKYPRVYVSINTVINKDNIHELVKTYEFLKNAKINRWTISFPRLVENALERNFRVPIIRELVLESKKLLKEYEKDKKPFDMTISYFYKYEFSKKEKYLTPNLKLSNHPCLPNCNGGRGLIVDSFGNILDCLTLKPFMKKPVNIKSFLSKKNKKVGEFISLLYQSLDSKFYFLKADKKECLDCRYLNLCKGGCPANAYYLLGRLNRADIVSCLLFYTFEKEILPCLSEEEAEVYKKTINPTKKIQILEKRINSNRKILTQIGCFR